MQRYYFLTEHNRAMIYAELHQPGEALASIRRAEAIFEPQWAETNPAFNVQIDFMYAVYYRMTGEYDKALELFKRIQRFDNEAGMDARALEWEKEIADVYFEKGDLTTAAAMYHNLIKEKQKQNNERFYVQLNELRTLRELDKAELAATKHLAEIHRQRIVNTALSLGCIAMALIVALTVWSRKKIAEKNRGLYLQIKEHDRLSEELNALFAQNNVGARHALPLQAQPPSLLHGDSQQQKLVALFHEYLTKDRRYSNSEINLDTIIAALSTNRTYLFEATKAVTNKTPVDYLNDLRLEEARQMLESNYEINVEEISENCGFNSRATFYRLFRERYKINPAEYRRIARKP
jgi:AraC-like DNA-binding protein